MALQSNRYLFDRWSALHYWPIATDLTVRIAHARRGRGMKLQKKSLEFNLIFRRYDPLIIKQSGLYYLPIATRFTPYVEHAWKSKVWSLKKIHRIETDIQAKCSFVLQEKCLSLLTDRNQNCTFCSVCVYNARCSFMDINWIKAVINTSMYFALKVKCPSLFTDSNLAILHMELGRREVQLPSFQEIPYNWSQDAVQNVLCTPSTVFLIFWQIAAILTRYEAHGGWVRGEKVNKSHPNGNR